MITLLAWSAARAAVEVTLVAGIYPPNEVGSACSSVGGTSSGRENCSVDVASVCVGGGSDADTESGLETGRIEPAILSRGRRSCIARLEEGTDEERLQADVGTIGPVGGGAGEVVVGLLLLLSLEDEGHGGAGDGVGLEALRAVLVTEA